MPGVAEVARVITASVMVPTAPPAQAWMPAAGGNESSAASADQQEAERNECVAEMQDQHEPLARRAVSGPAREPGGLQNAGDQQRRARRRQSAE